MFDSKRVKDPYIIAFSRRNDFIEARNVSSRIFGSLFCKYTIMHDYMWAR